MALIPANNQQPSGFSFGESTVNVNKNIVNNPTWVSYMDTGDSLNLQTAGTESSYILDTGAAEHGLKVVTYFGPNDDDEWEWGWALFNRVGNQWHLFPGIGGVFVPAEIVNGILFDFNQAAPIAIGDTFKTRTFVGGVSVPKPIFNPLNPGWISVESKLSLN